LVDNSADKWNSEQSQQYHPKQDGFGLSRGFRQCFMAHAVLPQEDGIVRSAVKTLLVLFVLTLALATQAIAANYIVIVDVAPGASAKDIAAAYEGKVIDQLDSNTYLMSVKSLTPKSNASGLVSMVSNDSVGAARYKGGVVSVKPSSRPNWYFAQPSLKLIGLDQAVLVEDGAGIIIADINSAVDYSHPALRGHLIAGYDFILGRPTDLTLNQSSASFLDQSSASFLDQSSASFLDQSSASFLDQSSASFLDQSSASFLDATNPAHGHGTMVAGILVAVAPGAMIMPLRAFDDQGQSDEFTIAKAIRWAVDHGADVINMSFGTLSQPKVLKDAINYADRNGVTIIGSAGNDNTDAPQYPAAFDKVVSVGATDLLDFKASFSNYGGSIDVVAPGVSIIAPYPGGYYAVVSGTSFSAPIVAGEAALIRALSTKHNAKDPIRNGTIKIDQRNPGKKLGQGRISLPLGLNNK
jgi:subtilisin family serine protease